jgi:hypothetical protein
MSRRYDKPKAGQWVRPIKRGYRLMCCDCGLVHKMDFEHVKWGRGRKVLFRVWRDDRATGAARKAKRFT